MIRVAVAVPLETVAVNRRRMRHATRVVLEGEGVKHAEISLAFVDSATIRRLNKQYLNHGEPTDVLSFPLGRGPGDGLAGEVVVGAEVAKAQAGARGHDLQAELALYVIHGVLHLCGYDDATAAGAAEMRTRERHYLSALSLPDIAGS
jgi:probable rRNA maturation factor